MSGKSSVFNDVRAANVPPRAGAEWSLNSCESALSNPCEVRGDDRDLLFNDLRGGDGGGEKRNL